MPPTQPPLELRTRQVGPWQMNTYALVCPASGASVLIDPGDEPDVLQEMLGDSRPVAILLTHDHIDHIGALDEMRARLGVPLLAHPGPTVNPQRVSADRWLADGERIAVGDHWLRVVYAPGHIGNQVCFLLENDSRAIVGDTIFAGGPGKTWSSEGFQQTLATLRDVVLVWDDDTLCYPGHGPSFRLGDLRARVEAFVARDHGDFFGDAEWER